MSTSNRQILVSAAAPALAITVFGVIYGSLARPLMGAGAVMLSSLLIFSGAVQFTIAALLAIGAGAGAVVVGAMTLNLRNFVLGAVLRPRMKGTRARRAGLAWFLLDESAGLALASPGDPTRTLLISGLLFYVAWQIGTVVGLLGATVEGVRSAAQAVFPALFVGLAAVTCSSRSILVRAIIAGVVAGIGAFVWPGGRAVLAVLAAIAISIPDGDR